MHCLLVYLATFQHIKYATKYFKTLNVKVEINTWQLL